MSTIPSFPNINDPRIQAALREVEPLEVGTVLNDHYSPDFYTERRARYLGRHRIYYQLRNGLFTVAKEDADDIFGSYEGDLSVQEVRRREICNEILPLLPFPTDQNTDTLNVYGGLPESEWAEDKEPARRVLTPTPSPPPPAPEGAANAQTMDAAIPASATGDGQSNEEFNANDLSRNQRPGRHVRFAAQTDMADAGVPGAAQPVPRPDNAVLVAGILDNLGQLYPTNNASTTNGAIPGPQNLDDQQIAAPAAQRSVPAAANRGAKRAAAGCARVSAPSYANRPTNTRVKVRRGSKRSRPDDDDDDIEYVSTDSEAGNDSSASADDAAPKKKLKLSAVPQPTKPKAAQRMDSRASSEMREVQPRRKASTAQKTKKKAATTKGTGKASGKTSGKTGGKSNYPTIDAIVAGTALPRSRAQATEADEARYALLIEAHNARARPRKKATAKTANEPELMPEYFQTSRFPADAAEEQVRCVCGVVTDDHMRMVCCDSDGCSVWQHVACVGDAKPKDLDNGAYRCHNCDPWAHRRVIQRLRKANVLTR